MRQHARYLIRTFLIAGIVIPLILQIAMIAGVLFSILAIVPWAFAVCLVIAIWRHQIKKEDLPEDRFYRYLPIVAAYFWYILAFIICFGLSGYQLGNDIYDYTVMLSMPWFFLYILISLSGSYLVTPLVITGFYIGIFLAYLFAERIKKGRVFHPYRIYAMAGSVVFVLGIYGIQSYQRSQRIIQRDFAVERVEDEVNLYEYMPFSERSSLKRLNQPASLTISSDYPRLDGATAAYPVYAAITQEIYQGLDQKSVEEYVKCSKTSGAYERLIKGETDIFFGAEPSKLQREAAAQAGVELCLTPIGKEAFVFFVNIRNPVEELTVEQIQDIYQKKVTDWDEVGGQALKIIPFQRPEGSGSQTIMQKIMDGKRLPPPLIEEYAAGMGGIINGVANYQNHLGSIGYSFRYYATGMKPNRGIKLLAVNGISPGVEEIQAGTYPFTQTVYAVTTKEPDGNVKLLLEWILSEQGQGFIEKCGYVKLEQ